MTKLIIQMQNKYLSTWTKYLPVIKIILKRSVAGEQVFNLNISDFKLAGAIKKSGYKFVICFIDGKVDNLLTSDISKDLTAAILEDDQAKDIITQKDFQISMNEKFQLSIKFLDKNSSEQATSNEGQISREVIETATI